MNHNAFHPEYLEAKVKNGRVLKFDHPHLIICLSRWCTQHGSRSILWLPVTNEYSNTHTHQVHNFCQHWYKVAIHVPFKLVDIVWHYWFIDIFLTFCDGCPIRQYKMSPDKSSFQIVTFILLLSWSWTDLLFFQLEWTYFSVISAKSKIQVRVWIWSMFISTEILVPIAVFHTANQKLKISHAFCVVDHANHWLLSLCKETSWLTQQTGSEYVQQL